MFAMGVDLGTANVRAAICDRDGPRNVRFPHGASELPAVVSMGDRTAVVGLSAQQCARTRPHRTVRGVKRLIGRKRNDPIVDHVAGISGLRLESRPDGGVVIRMGHDIVSPAAITKALLDYLMLVVERARGRGVEAAVIAAPRWFAAEQRSALANALKQAGPDRSVVVSESSAAMLGLHDNLPPGLIGLIDVGAAGVGASIYERTSHSLRCISSVADPVGGGEDVDWALVRAIVHGLAKHHGCVDLDQGTAALLRDVCEGVKHNLSGSSPSAIIPYLPVAGGLVNQRVRFDARCVDSLVSDVVERVRAACRAVLERAAIRRDALGGVVVLGGMSALPGLVEAVESELAACIRPSPPATAVALGGAYHAGMLVGLCDEIEVDDLPMRANELLPAPPRPARSRVVELDAFRRSTIWGAATLFEGGSHGDDLNDFIHITERVRSRSCLQQVVPSEVPERLRALCTELSRATAPTAASVGTLACTLDTVAHDGFVPLALQLLPSTRAPEVRDVFVRHVERFAARHLEAIGGVIARADAQSALRLLSVIRGSDGAYRALFGGTRSRHVPVRLETLAILQRAPQAVAWREVEALLDDPVASVRLALLDLVTERRVRDAAPALTRRACAESYHWLPRREQRAILVALAELDRQCAEALAIQVLESDGWVPARSRDAARVVAAEFLATSDSTFVLDALTSHAKRWLNSSALRKATARAAVAVEQRRSERPPPS